MSNKIPYNMKQSSCYNYNVGKEYICPTSFENIPFKSNLAQDYMYSDWFKAVNANRIPSQSTKCANIGCKNKYYNCQSEKQGNEQRKKIKKGGNSGCSCNKFPLHNQTGLSDFSGMTGGGCGCTGTPNNLLKSVQSGGSPAVKSCGCQNNQEKVPNFNLLHGGCILPMCLLGGNRDNESTNYGNASLLTDNYPRNTCNTHLDPNSKHCKFMKYDRDRYYNSDSNKYIEGPYFDLCQGQIGNRPIVSSHDNHLKVPNTLKTDCPNFVGKTVNCQQPFWDSKCI